MAESKKQISLAEKLNHAIAEIGPVGKDGQNNYQGYRFQSEAAIKSAVKRVIAENGFNIIPSYTVLGQRDVKGSKGRLNHIVDVLGKFTITDGNPDTDIIGTMPGSGMDTGEKAMAKACTSAQKYFFKQLFNISDKDEDPDATNSNIGARYDNQPHQQQSQRKTPSNPKRSSMEENKDEYEWVVNKIIEASKGKVSEKSVKDQVIKIAGFSKNDTKLTKASKMVKAAYSILNEYQGGKQQ